MRVPTVPSGVSGAGWQGLRGAAAAFGWKRAGISLAVLLVTGFAGLKGYERMRPAVAPTELDQAGEVDLACLRRGSKPVDRGA